MAKSHFIIGIFCFAALALVSDVHGMQSSQKTIVQLASNDPALSTFVTALKAANLTETLSGAGSFTVFAPTNKAFSNIPKATLAHLLDPANVRELVDLLEYHVLTMTLQSKELKNMTVAESLEGKYLVLKNVVNPSVNELVVNDALATFVDLQASNGVVHIIDHVLLPTYTSDLNIMEIITSKPELSTFATALRAGLLNGALEGNGRLQRFAEFDIWAKFVNQCAYGIRGPSLFNIPSNGAQCPFTVVAPSNEAFAKLPQATLDHLLNPTNVGELQALLEFHIIPGLSLIAGAEDKTTDQFTMQGFYSTLLGSTNLNADRSDNGTTLLSPYQNHFNGPVVKEKTSLIIQANLGASNGIVHVIDSVLIPRAPTKTIFAGLVANAQFGTGTIVTALKAGLLERSLNDPNLGPYTLFAPSDDAFAKLPKATLDHLLDPKNIGELQNILEYHIVPGVAMRTGCRMSGRTCGQGDVEANRFIKTLAGRDVTITTKGEVGVDGQVMIDNSNIVPFENSYADGTGQSGHIENNGIWYIIDQVLMPTTPKPAFRTICDVVAATPNLSTLGAALKATQFNTICERGPYTVFAPSNTAFARLPKATLAHLLDPANVEELAFLLEYHIAPRALYAKDLTNNEKIATTSLHNTVTVRINPSQPIRINDAFVTTSDVGASNGVIHIIDTVLTLPNKISLEPAVSPLN